MIAISYPWLLVLLPVPLLVIKWARSHQTVQSSVRVPSLENFAALTGDSPSRGAVVLRRSRGQLATLIVVWFAVVLSAARPQWVGDPIEKTIPSRDLLLAVDLSGSMEAEDFTDSQGKQVDRLTAVKEVLDDFLSRREGDRVGLIFFGSAAFVQAPFTEDLELCRTLLDEAQVRMAGPQTVIGDAIGLSLTVFDRSEQEDRVLILLTDGNDTGSKVPPEQAAEIARDKGVTIHTIAVGDPSAVGEEKIDEESLQSISKTTGGGFFRASDRDELAKIYDRLDQIETRDVETESYRPKTDLFHWPLAVFLIVGLMYHGMVAVRSVPRATVPLAAAMSAVLLVAATDFGSPTGFHFLRPLWLISLLPAALIIRSIIQGRDGGGVWQGVIDPELLASLLVKPDSDRKGNPVYLLGLTWSMAAIALAGPTWQREPSPFAEDEAAVVFVIEATPSMLCQDIQPSRHERAVHKVGDLLALRPGTDAALIAYAGSAHLVMPLTSDAEIIKTFAGELTPDIMPLEGDVTAEAIAMASEQLSRAGRPGSIVLITDGIDPSQDDLLRGYDGSPVHILAVAGDQSKPLPLGSPPAPALDLTALSGSAKLINASVTVVSVDDSDIQKLSRSITSSFIAASQSDGGDRWKDMGYWLTPLLVLVTLYWFRPGWVVRWE